jgi:GH24 family phage-related lysozyme (muramidase)
MRNKTTTAKFVAASVAGYLHIGQKLPCQDYYKYVTGRNIVAVLSDGAGSAKYGKIGAKNLCTTLCDLLKNADFNHIEDQIIHAVKVVRQKLMMHRLNKTKDEQGLAPFSATLVGVVYKGSRGIFFHIGDGAAVSLHPDSTFTASRPENGDFSCETFFFTQMAWRENLRFTKFENAKSIMLMSDGLTSFAFRAGFAALEHEFIMPINSFLSAEKSITKAQKALSNTLNTPRAQKLNPDDKTLVWIKVA